MTIADLLSKSYDERKSTTAGELQIDTITFDDIILTGYKAFSFIEEITYTEEPSRSINGTMSNLDNIPSFITPRLQIDFSLLTIDNFRNFLDRVKKKKEHRVTCYNIATNQVEEYSMYVAPLSMPKLFTLARVVNGQKKVELLGVRDYTIELIGTNRPI